MKSKELVSDIKSAIIRAKQEGATDRAVAGLFKVGHATVSRIYQRFKVKKTVANLPRSGRPRKSTERNDRALVKIIKDNPRKTATDVAAYANGRLGLGITTRTARNILK